MKKYPLLTRALNICGGILRSRLQARMEYFNRDLTDDEVIFECEYIRRNIEAEENDRRIIADIKKSCWTILKIAEKRGKNVDLPRINPKGFLKYQSRLGEVDKNIPKKISEYISQCNRIESIIAQGLSNENIADAKATLSSLKEKIEKARLKEPRSFKCDYCGITVNVIYKCDFRKHFCSLQCGSVYHKRKWLEQQKIRLSSMNN